VTEANVAEAEAEAAWSALGRQRLATARAEITEARTALAEARAPPLPTAPPTKAFIHDIIDDDDDVPSHFACAGDQQVLLACNIPGLEAIK
jgi:hypothetical protein